MYHYNNFSTTTFPIATPFKLETRLLMILLKHLKILDYSPSNVGRRQNGSKFTAAEKNYLNKECRYLSGSLVIELWFQVLNSIIM